MSGIQEKLRKYPKTNFVQAVDIEGPEDNLKITFMVNDIDYKILSKELLKLMEGYFEENMKTIYMQKIKIVSLARKSKWRWN